LVARCAQAGTRQAPEEDRGGGMDEHDGPGTTLAGIKVLD